MKRGASAVAIAALLLASCGGGGGGSGGGGGGDTPPSPPPPPTPPPPSGVYVAPAQDALSAADVQQVIANAVAEAQARGLPANIAVVDRVGNVLAVFSMTGANQRLQVPTGPNGSMHDLQGIDVPGAVAGAIAKAVTGAYLSSAGNAFSTRTASAIVQEHFPPSAAARGLESGPLFGVQFSQLPCSDLNTRFTSPVAASGFVGPKRSPLGLAADPGGFPLYRNGVLIGGVGIMGDGLYGFDTEVRDTDRDAEETIALAATRGFEAPIDIRADRVSVDGTLLRYSDATAQDFASTTVQPFSAINGPAGSLTTVRGYYDATFGVLAGSAYGSEASGIRQATAAEFSTTDAFVLSNGAGANRFPIRPGTDGAQALSATEVRTLLEEAFRIMSAARAQIRRPLDSRAQVTISIVDTNGVVLGIVRSPDAPIFGIDVSLQKARTATFFSSASAGASLQANPDPDVSNYVAAFRSFLGDPSALTGQTAFSDRAIGNVSRPYFPDGELGRPPGALSRPIAEFNPFSTGLQSALIEANVKMHVGFVLGQPTDTPAQCTHTPRLANGIQIFPGAVPVYRGGQLVGGIGVSGDGIDQDDMISFLGAHNAGVRLGTIGNAATPIRSDQVLVPVGDRVVRLRYVGCPFNPFIGSDDQNVCQGR